MTTIAILAAPRTGSTLLCKLTHYLAPIRQLDEVFFHADQLNDREISKIESFFNKPNITKQELMYIVRHYPEECYGLIEKDSLLSFKIHDWQTDANKYDWLFARNDTKFILLERKSLLSRYISTLAATETKIWTNADTSSRKYTIDIDHYKEFCNISTIRYRRYLDLLDKNNHNFLHLTYEDDLDIHDHSLTYNKIISWARDHNIILEYKPNNIADNYILMKQNKSLLSESILNYNEVISAIELDEGSSLI